MKERLLQNRKAARSAGSPFVPISAQWRLALISFVVLYEVALPGVNLLLHGAEFPLAGARFAASASYYILLIAPLIFYRRSWGWLHPLLFLPLLGFATQIAREPEFLLGPIRVFTTPLHESIYHAALFGWSPRDLAMNVLAVEMISIFALIFYYLGFFISPRLSVPKIQFHVPRNLQTRALILVAAGIIFFLFYLEARGGLGAHLASMSKGRFTAMAGDGHIITMIRVGLVATYAWYSFSKKAGRNPLFWISSITFVLMEFVLMGSRSGLLYAATFFFLIWILRHRKLPKAQILIGAASALVIVGFLGDLRQRAFRQADTSEVSIDFDLQEALQSGKDEVQRREAINGFRGVIAHVPDKADLLYGESYVGALLFFIPRAIWEGKPRGPGALYTERILGHRYGAKAIPIGVEGEAYWNFHLPGVAIIFLLFGMFHRWLARLFRLHATSPAIWLIYLITLRYLQPSTSQMVPYFHQIFLLLFVLWFFGVISFKGGAPTAKRSTGVRG